MGLAELPARSSQAAQLGEEDMFSTIGRFKSISRVVLLAGLLLFLGPATCVKAWASPAQSDESQIAQEIQSKLSGNQYKNVKVSVNNGVATLSGTVDLYVYKADADQKAHKVKGVKAVANDIQVAGPNIPDQQLQQKLQEEVNYSRVGYGTTTFTTVKVNVQGDGDVTLSGHVYDYIDRNDILALVSTTKGVKNLTDNMQVEPTSIMDDQIRVQVARAIYSFPSLQKYWINPNKPIRIAVQNGHVELYGVVDNKADREAAFLRANQVPGVFSVQNNIQVAGQPPIPPQEKGGGK
jgi:hyperosmotically inducible protein